MKKVITAMLVAGMILSFASCTNNNNESTTTEATTTEATTTESTSNEETTTENAGGEEVASADAKATLEGVYNSFLDKLAPAFGASSGEEISTYFAGPEMETITEVDPETNEEFSYEMPKAGAGAIDLSNPENLFNTLLPIENADKLDSAACFYNMMNMNNGTFAAFELKDASEAQAIADALKEAITGNMWMCGFPERYLIVNIDGVVVSAFGIGDATNALKDAIAEKYENAVVIYDEAL